MGQQRQRVELETGAQWKAQRTVGKASHPEETAAGPLALPAHWHSRPTAQGGPYSPCWAREACESAAQKTQINTSQPGPSFRNKNGELRVTRHLHETNNIKEKGQEEKKMDSTIG